MVVPDNKDDTNGVNATVDVGAAVTGASAISLSGPTPSSLTWEMGITLAGGGSTKDGAWNSSAPYAMTTTGNNVSLPVRRRVPC
jgi:hypothetical protein